MNEIKHPQPLKFEDLTPGMWYMMLLMKKL